MNKIYRIEQLNSLVQRLFSEIIQREGNLPENFLVTVTKVEISKDLANAKIFLSVYPKVAKEIENYFKKNIFDFQQSLNKKLNIHPVPKVKIIFDVSEGKAEEIERALKEANKSGNKK